MPKRKADESKEDKWLRKLKKYEGKLKSKRSRVIYSSESDEEIVDHLMEDIPYETNTPVVTQSLTEENIVDDVLPSNTEKNPDLNPDDDIDRDLLQTLGEVEPEVTEWGEEIHVNISKRCQPILENGLTKETREELSKKYLVPKNIPLAKAPILNPEISSMLSDNHRTRDKTIMNKQEQLGKALSVLGSAISGLIRINTDKRDILKKLNDCCLLIADSHFAETYTRRSLIIPLVDKSLMDPLKERKRDKLLFGENLGDMVKNSKSIKKTGNLMQPTTSAGSLNWKRPPARTQPRYNTQAFRSGGRQYTKRGRATIPPLATSRRYAPPAPPAQAPTRRQPPPARRQPAPRDRHQL